MVLRLLRVILAPTVTRSGWLSGGAAVSRFRPRARASIRPASRMAYSVRRSTHCQKGVGHSQDAAMFPERGDRLTHFRCVLFHGLSSYYKMPPAI